MGGDKCEGVLGEGVVQACEGQQAEKSAEGERGSSGGGKEEISQRRSRLSSPLCSRTRTPPAVSESDRFMLQMCFDFGTWTETPPTVLECEEYSLH